MLLLMVLRWEQVRLICLLPTDDLPSAAREFTLIFDDGETTEIMKVASQEKAPQGYYDLQGRRVANPTSGLYIVNGKKVIIK